MEFIVSITNNFEIGPDNVRVAVMMFSREATVDIEFDQYNDKASLQAAIRAIPYYRGVTYTHAALDALRTQVMTDDKIRADVPQ